MSAVTIRNLSSETHRALKAMAEKHQLSTEAQIRLILDEAVRPRDKTGLGSAIHALAMQHGGFDIEFKRDKALAASDAASFE